MGEKKKAVTAFILTAVFIFAGIVLLWVYDEYQGGKSADWMGYLALLLFAISMIAFIFGMWFAFHNKSSTTMLGVSCGLDLFTVAMIWVNSYFSADFSDIIALFLLAIIVATASIACFIVGIVIVIVDHRRRGSENESTVRESRE